MLVYKKKRQQVSKNRVYTTGKERTCGSIFLDSGAHTLFTEFWIKPERKGLNPGYSYYRSKRFKAYVDKYAEFVKAHLDVLDHYVTVDAIFEPRISWQVTKYLEREHGLSPVPVLHFGTPMKWVEKYLAGGYDYLGIGGLGQEVSKQMYYAWADRLFDRLCDNQDRTPCVRTHAFAINSYPLVIRYPWYSVDGSSWAKLAGYGCVYVPHVRWGKFDFSVSPYIIGFSHRSRARKVKGAHYLSCSRTEQAAVQKWLDHIGLKVGSVDKDGNPTEVGVLSQYNSRAVANLRFFEELQKWLGPYPRRFNVVPRKGLFGGGR